ncbi:MAG: TonB-dependent receptor [Ignavibacteriales bacterium]|nr:TonB-dependent receptor [Ignavibacteriales bacterium]
MRLQKLIFILLLMLSQLIFSQNIGEITGKVIDRVTKEGLPGVNVIVEETNFGSSTDLNGEFKIQNIPVGNYKVRASFIGYDAITKADVIVNSAKPTFLEFRLSESIIELEGVTVTSNFFETSPVDVNSVKKFSYEEIRRAPGGFEDVIRALSILPGVARQSAGRNDLVVRGGAPSENLYVVDGFVIPNINHFGNQGATGGPLSFVNLDYVSETTFSTGGFQANYGDKLSSVLKIDLREARKDRIGGKALVSASQFGFNLEGPASDNSNFIFSIRRSYLDFIFNAAGFNFVPEYYDLLTKYTYDIDNSNKISYLFVGALDRVIFNNENSEDIYDNSRILGNDQNQYVTGISYRHLFNKGFYNLTLSRNYVSYDGFQNDTLLNPIFLNNSKEAEHELKLDAVMKIGKASELNFGVSGKHINFQSDILFPDQFVTTFGETLPITQANVNDDYYKASSYILYSAYYFNSFRFNFGLRGNYFNAIDDKFTVSPRLSMSYDLTSLTKLNFSTGIYRQSPSYIWLTLDENKSLKPIQVNQYILGITHLLTESSQIKLEAFYKDYSKYPTSNLRTYLVLANTGAGYPGADDNFSTYGLEKLTSDGKGFSRGLEFSMQKKSATSNHYGVLSVTYSQSKFTGLDNIERTGQYDQTWIVSLSAGYIFNENWEASMKFRYATGNPYTPYNFDGTQNIPDYLTARLDPTHSLDLRVDRRWDFNGWNLIAYIDIQNVYNKKNDNNVKWDYKTMQIDKQSDIGILPSIGISVEF